MSGGGALGRPHVARALVSQGAVATVAEAFHQFLRRGRPAFVEKPLPPLSEVTGLIHDVGGVAVAAHLGPHGTDAWVRTLKDDGIDGVEVRHPSHDLGDERRLVEIAQRLDLAITGGSDWHGDEDHGTSHTDLGGLDIPAEWLAALEGRRKAG
jgi:hypothetical protein